jgi:hypothetical protein
MNDRLNIDLARMGKKWVACFDLLGFSKLTNSSLVSAFYQVEQCLSELQFWSGRKRKLGCTWFSDTFLIYTANDSAGSFVTIESVSRYFFQLVLLRNIPLRGAMACDEFYADETNRIFVGKALVDSVQFGERCNWVGFVLCPSAVCQMEKINLPVTCGTCSERYKLWDVPTKQKVLRSVEPFEETIIESSEKARALLCGAIQGNGEDFMRALKAMSERTDSPKDKVKYANSIQFLNHFGVAK